MKEAIAGLFNGEERMGRTETNGTMKDKLLYAAVAAFLGLAGGGWGGSALTEKTNANAAALAGMQTEFVAIKTEQAATKTEVREKHAGITEHLDRIEKVLDRIDGRLRSLHVKGD